MTTLTANVGDFMAAFALSLLEIVLLGILAVCQFNEWRKETTSSTECRLMQDSSAVTKRQCFKPLKLDGTGMTYKFGPEYPKSIGTRLALRPIPCKQLRLR